MKFVRPRESGRIIAAQARHVSLNLDKVRECAKDIIAEVREKGQASLSGLFTQCDLHPREANESGVNWVFFADTINFSMWYNDDEPQYLVTYKGRTEHGYLAVCAAINRTLDSGIPLTTPSFYQDLTEGNLNRYLMGDNGVPCPLIKERVACLRESATVVLSKYDGSFMNVIKKAEKSAARLLDIIVQDFPSFRDVADWNGQTLGILKRAQILVSDIYGLFRGQGPAEFPDLDTLTMFADYRVPQSLHFFGILDYSKELMEKLQANEMLPNGSRMEVEIRGCSIRAVELITEQVKTLAHPDLQDTNDAVIDYYLWNLRRKKSHVMKKHPYHKTRSIFY